VKKRLPLLLFAAVGLWVWQGGAGFFPSERQLSWRYPGDYGSIRRAELQLWDGDTLLKREELSYPQGVTLEPTRPLALKAGTYGSKVLIWRADGGAPEVREATLQVDGQSAFTIGP
jgi:hypothetical protein